MGGVIYQNLFSTNLVFSYHHPISHYQTLAFLEKYYLELFLYFLSFVLSVLYRFRYLSSFLLASDLFLVFVLAFQNLHLIWYSYVVVCYSVYYLSLYSFYYSLVYSLLAFFLLSLKALFYHLYL